MNRPFPGTSTFNSFGCLKNNKTTNPRTIFIKKKTIIKILMIVSLKQK